MSESSRIDTSASELEELALHCEKTDTPDWPIAATLRALSRERDALRAQVAALQRAVRGVHRVLDGMDNWSDHDVRANACSAFSIVQDALGAYTGNTTEEDR